MKTKKGVVTMKVKDGFKFGVGYFLGKIVVIAIIDIVTGDALSKLKKPTNTEKDEKPEEVTE